VKPQVPRSWPTALSRPTVWSQDLRYVEEAEKPASTPSATSDVKSDQASARDPVAAAAERVETGTSDWLQILEGEKRMTLESRF
jgi:hypothetical protein|tara:strand:- start:76 stop:327 length:252 start_codon:yes stop_codon:yes gene_type:complete